MKVAIFHDYFGAIGGGENVVLMMADALGADIITTDTDAVTQIARHGDVLSIGNTVKIAPFKQISAAARFAACDFSDDYDFFIFSGNWSHHAARKHHPNLWYCHILIGAMNNEQVPFYDHAGFLFRNFYRFGSSLNRPLDRRSIANIDRIVANSKNVRDQIRQHYGRTAEILYPAVDVSRYVHREAGDYWLSVNRLYPEKRIELQVDAFRMMPEERLIVVGGHAAADHSSPYIRWLKRDLPENVTLAGEVPFDELVDLYSRSKGLICTSFNEPFGITPLEAMASGKAVVAVKSGGFLETVTEETGILVNPDPVEIVMALREIMNDIDAYRKSCLERARLFDISIFQKRIREIVQFQND